MDSDWIHVEVIDLMNDGSGLGFGIIGGKSTGVLVKTILAGSVSDRVRRHEMDNLIFCQLCYLCYYLLSFKVIIIGFLYIYIISSISY